jgi:hypothetical protein
LAVDASLVPDRLKVLAFYGYDFDAASIQVLLQNGSQYLDVSQHLAKPTHYHMTLDLGRTGVQLSPNSRRFVLKWKDQEISSVTISQPPPPAPVPRRKITVKGKIDIKDDEWFSDEYGHLKIDEEFILSPGSRRPLQYIECVGGEVRVELELTVQLRRDLISFIDVTAVLFEGTSCSTDDKEDSKRERIIVPPDGPPVHWRYELLNTETGGGDWAKFNLTFTNSKP